MIIDLVIAPHWFISEILRPAAYGVLVGTLIDLVLV